MRVIRCALILTCVLLGVRDLTPVAHAQKMTYGVKVMVAKAADLANAKTYSWTVSQPSPDKTVDALIVAAVDRQLTALGFTKVASGASDVLTTYASTRRTDVNLKGKANESGARPAYEVGTLVVDLRDPSTRQPLFRVRIDTPITTEPEKAEMEINAAVTAMFEKYPGRTGAKR
jgi:hypothetical protein